MSRGNKTNKLKMEFSKKILLTAFIVAIIVLILSFILMYVIRDLSPLSYIITGIMTVITTATSFYFWKAKNENMAKNKYYKEDVEE